MKKLLFLLVLINTNVFSQHIVRGSFSPSENFTYAYLYKASPSSFTYIDHSKIETDGTFKIELGANINAGMYKIVYGIPEEANNFDFIYNGKEDVILTFSLDEGLEFKESVENKLWASYTKIMELVNMTIGNFYKQESTDKKAFKDIFKTLKDTQEAFEGASKGTMAYTFIKANSPYIPTEYEDVKTYSNHLKTSFLTHIDFGNTLLQSSDFLTDRVMAYVFGMSAVNSDDDHKQHIDDVVKTIGNEQPAISSALLEQIWEKFVELNNVTMANYVSDTYLLKLANSTGNNDLSKTLINYKNNAKGMIAQDFEITYQNNGKTITTTLYELNEADHYLLIFWSSTCSHCLEEIPMLKMYLDAHPKNIKILAFGIEEGKENWEKTIPNFPDFMHVLGLGQWENPVVVKYNLSSTPSYFVLDKNKKIVAKPNDLEALKVALERL